MATYIRAHEAKAGDQILAGVGLVRTVTEVREHDNMVTIFTRGTQFTVDPTHLFVLVPVS